MTRDPTDPLNVFRELKPDAAQIERWKAATRRASDEMRSPSRARPARSRHWLIWAPALGMLLIGILIGRLSVAPASENSDAFVENSALHATIERIVAKAE